MLAGTGLSLAGMAAGSYVAVGQGNDEPACTLIGCAGGVQVTLRQMPAQAARVRLCVNRHCGKATRIYRTGPTYLHSRVPREARRAGARVRVRVVLLDREGRVLATIARRPRVTRFTPNGDGCPPTCFGAGFDVRGRGGRFTVS